MINKQEQDTIYTTAVSIGVLPLISEREDSTIRIYTFNNLLIVTVV